ncbi:MAG TPA: GNAT family protein [Candidatus Nanoarchaeia archaeon]|nr:GNAT family protein [Candidatus Nanoarchaeia archaeon]
MVKLRVYLRPMKLEDAKLVSNWYNDPETRKYMSTVVRGYTYYPRDIKKEIKENNPKEEQWLMVCLKSNGKPIGQAGIDELDFLDKRGEIFFLIGDKAEKGKGYSHETIRLLLDFAFKKLKLNSLYATATVKNIPSLKVLERAGFRKIGVRREYNYIGGKFLDEVLYDLTKKDYRKLYRK